MEAGQEIEKCERCCVPICNQRVTKVAESIERDSQSLRIAELEKALTLATQYIFDFEWDHYYNHSTGNKSPEEVESNFVKELRRVLDDK